MLHSIANRFPLWLKHCFLASQGALSGLFVGLVVGVWLGIGSFLYPPANEFVRLLPLSTEGCSNVTLHFILSRHQSPKPILIKRFIKYFYAGRLGSFALFSNWFCQPCKLTRLPCDHQSCYWNLHTASNRSAKNLCTIVSMLIYYFSCQKMTRYVMVTTSTIKNLVLNETREKHWLTCIVNSGLGLLKTTSSPR